MYVDSVLHQGTTFRIFLPRHIPGAEELVPREIVARLNAETAKVLRSAPTVERLQGLGLTTEPGTPEEFAALITSELARWGSIVRAANIRAE